MSNTVVIIPSRLKARRLPNKPLKLINGKEMISHVYDLAKASNVGKVLVVTPDKEIDEIIKKKGGESYLSSTDHPTGTDRVFEGFKNFYSSKPSIVINLQGDMPNLNPKAIVEINNYMQRNICDMATLGSLIKNYDENQNKNIVKVVTKDNIEISGFSEALDFTRILKDSGEKFVYHHIGIYAFTSKALINYVNLKRSKLEMERNLEQMRAMENNIKIHVGYSSSKPLGVDTNDDLEEIKKIMEK